MSILKFLQVASLFGLISAVSAQEITWSTQSSSGTSVNQGVQITAVTGQAATQISQGGNIQLSSGFLPQPPDSGFIFIDSYE